MAIGIGVGRHRHGAQRQLAQRLGGIVIRHQ
jgi:hypothetical protein